MFFGTWSFTEADLQTRELVKEQIKGIGIIWLVFWDKFENTNNGEYFLKWIREERLHVSHNILSFALLHSNPPPQPSFNFVAVRKDLRKMSCTVAAGCHPSVLHTRIHELLKAYNNSFLWCLDSKCMR